MAGELTALLGVAASIAFIHTLLGPDHVLPFVALSRERGWSAVKTALITGGCGLGHAAGSIILGAVGVVAGTALTDLKAIEAVRGDLAAWMLVAFGLIYMAWGIKRSARSKPHSHWHAHADGTAHDHDHSHHKGHVHVHDAAAGKHPNESKKSGIPGFAPWTIFIIFLLGPCEPLIPLMMVPAASADWPALVLVTGVFTGTTVITMIAVVLALCWGVRSIPGAALERHRHALAGGTLALGGLLVIGLGV